MTLGSHQKSVGKSQVHITPKWIIDALGPFDLDPCAAWPRPWDCAFENIALPMDGLVEPWWKKAFIWLNPPFDRYGVETWMKRLADHNNGIALLHARTETDWFRVCWEHASSFLFLDKRISFCRPDGSVQPANSGAPPVLVGFGQEAKNRLATCSLSGYYLTSWKCKPRKES